MGQKLEPIALLERLTKQFRLRQMTPKGQDGGPRLGAGRKPIRMFTPAEILLEIQIQSKGYTEIDVVIKTPDPFNNRYHTIGVPTKVRGLEAGEIMKLRRDLEAWLIRWRTELALERKDEKVKERVKIKEGSD